MRTNQMTAVSRTQADSFWNVFFSQIDRISVWTCLEMVFFVHFSICDQNHWTANATKRRTTCPLRQEENSLSSSASSVSVFSPLQLEKVFSSTTWSQTCRFTLAFPYVRSAGVSWPGLGLLVVFGTMDFTLFWKNPCEQQPKAAVLKVTEKLAHQDGNLTLFDPDRLGMAHRSMLKAKCGCPFVRKFQTALSDWI